MDDGRQRRVPRALSAIARRGTPLVLVGALAVGALGLAGFAESGTPLIAEAGAPTGDEEPGGAGGPATSDTGAGQAADAATLAPEGRVDAAPDDAVTVLVAPGGEGGLAPGTDLTVTVDIVNRTETDLDAGELAVAIGTDTIDSRSEYSAWLDAGGTAAPETASLRTDAPAVEAGETETVTITVPAGELPFDDASPFGPRRLAVQHVIASELTAEGRSAIVVGTPVDAQPTPLSVVVPIVPPSGTKAVLDAGELRELTAAGGYLTQLLDAVEGTSATLAIDPRLLVSVRALGNAAPAPAVAWLERLEGLDNPSFELPYADADLTLQRQAGLTEPLSLLGPEFVFEPIDGAADPAASPEPTATDAPDEAGTPGASGTTGTAGTDQAAADDEGGAIGDDADPDAASASAGSVAPDAASPGPTETEDAPDGESSRPTLDELTAFPYTVESVAWPVSGTLSTDDLAAFGGWGYRGVIVEDAAAERLADYDFTPAYDLNLDGWSAMSTDSELSSAFELAASTNSTADRDAAITQLSTVLAIVTRELPQQPRSLLATAGRTAPTDPVALGETLRAVDALAWQTPGTLEVPDLTEGDVPVATLREGAHAEVAVARVLELLGAEERASEFATMFDDPEHFRSERRAALLALFSASWAADRDEWSVVGDAFMDYTTATEASVAITDSSDIQLIGREAQFPVFVRNDTELAVTVQVVLEPTTGRLEAGEPVTIRIEPGSMARAQVPMQAISNGNAEVDARILTPDGVELLSSQRLRVNVQAEWETAVVVTAALALTTLFVWGVVRTVRRRRHEKVGASSAGAVPPGGTSVSSEGE
ncbi:hypothetical protein GCM10011490_19390 [Pseudoclavibacter endophyticus]|uniref:Uncharacterized protein n=1 Tax=Pseudoclavibacter endophyticus TaxID=1778590 RepID=A0A6H9WN03_9MICO|nr:DUF6049 family protein [Pseudoclavibacter endophyticus]KAB1648006.1 hypothetical protein F8O04_09730 [Pseudoclavibacter endophyticus]GGA68983.1 hypothetical protein GCM10011490_19390 [Pseudoclavibacter endophyticus]